MTRSVQRALQLMRWYLSVRSDLAGRASDEESLRVRTERACRKVAKERGESFEQIWGRVLLEANRLGAVVPVLGRDL